MDKTSEILDLWLKFSNLESKNDLNFRKQTEIPGQKIFFTQIVGNRVRLTKENVKYLDYLLNTSLDNDKEDTTIYLCLPLLQQKNRLMPITAVNVSDAVDQLFPIAEDNKEEVFLDIDIYDDNTSFVTKSMLNSGLDLNEINQLDMSQNILTMAQSINNKVSTLEQAAWEIRKYFLKAQEGNTFCNYGVIAMMPDLQKEDAGWRLKKDFQYLLQKTNVDRNSIAYTYLYGGQPSVETKDVLCVGSFDGRVLGEGQTDVLRRYAANEPMVAVIGPPGTGKTTLAKNVVASTVTSRALEIAKGKDMSSVIFVVSNNGGAVVNLMDGLGEHELLKGKDFLLVGGNKENVGLAIKRIDEFVAELTAAEFSQTDYDETVKTLNAKYAEIVSSMKPEGINEAIEDLNDQREDLEEEKAEFEDWFKEQAIVKAVGIGNINAYALDLDDFAEDLIVYAKDFDRGVVGKVQDIFSNKRMQNLIEFISSYPVAKEFVPQNITGPQFSFKAIFYDFRPIPIIESILDQIDNIDEELQEVKAAYDDYKEVLDDLAVVDEKLQALEVKKAEAELGKSERLAKENQKLFETSLKLIRLEAIRGKQDVLNSLGLYRDYLATVTGQDKNDAFKTLLRDLNGHFRNISLVYPVISSTLDSSTNMFPWLKPVVDLCIVDEAGQIPCHKLFPTLCRSKRAIVVGDPKQLEPVITLSAEQIKFYHDKWQKAGYSEEEIERWSPVFATAYHRAAIAKDSKPTSLGNATLLDEHRRCHKTIAELFKEVGEYPDLKVLTKSSGRIEAILEEQYGDKRAILYDVKEKADSRNGLYRKDELVNKDEANKILQVLKDLQEMGVFSEIDLEKETEETEKPIGIITPFKRQKWHLSKILSDYKNVISLGTVHAFQGREHPVVILSTVVSSPATKGKISFFNEKPNLLNVAISRAKNLFICIGDADVLEAGKKYTEKFVNNLKPLAKEKKTA